MKVKELIELLQKVENKDLHVLTTDNDGWFYDSDGFLDKIKVYEGREDDKRGEEVIVLR